MQTRHWRWVAAVVLVAACWLAASPAWAGPLKHPKRVVEGHTVDLTPLFHWWTNHSGTRPLTAWVQVSGAIVATNSVGWVIAAHPEHPNAHGHETGSSGSGGESRIVLRHPPLAEAAEFETLQTQLRSLESQKLQLEAAVKRLSNPHVRGRGAGVINAEIRASAAEPRSELPVVEAQIKACRAKLANFADPNTFRVDCLALDSGANHGALPIYDYGSISGGG